MKSFIALVFIMLLFCTTRTADASVGVSDEKTRISIPSTNNNFLKNVKQWEPAILYQRNNVRFLKQGLSFYTLIEKKYKEGVGTNMKTSIIDADSEEADSVLVWNIVFKNSNVNANVTSNGEVASPYNFIYPDGAFAHVPVSNGIEYSDIYHHIDIKYYNTENNNELKYDVIVHPGADISDINLKYERIENLKINKLGQLEVNVRDGIQYIEEAPITYQFTNNGTIRNIKSKYVLREDNTFGFEVEEYDKSLDLIIDPLFRQWSTYMWAQDAYSYDNDIDNNGNVYITGWVAGQYPTTTGIFSANGFRDAYVAKLTPNGSTLLYFTFLGGSERDFGHAIDVDNNGSAYITGQTNSVNFPHSLIGFGTVLNGGLGSNGGLYDAYVTKLNPSGTGFVYSKFLGGAVDDYGWNIVVDKTTKLAYATGLTNSSNFPVSSGVVQAALSGNADAYITCIDSNGNNISFSTYFGGTDYEMSNCIVRDTSSGAIYIAGYTQSNNFPVSVGAFQTINYGLLDGFVAKFNSNCTARIYSTFIGGSKQDLIYGLDVNANSEPYVAGYTLDNASSIQHFPTTIGAIQTIANGPDGFVARFDSMGATLNYSTFLGGSNIDGAIDIKVNSANEAYVTGSTASVDFPITISNALQPIHGGGYDLFLSHVAANGKAFACGGSTFIGGSLDDYSYTRITLDKSGFFDTLIINGTSHSTNFPTTSGTYQPTRINDTLLDQPVVMKLYVDCGPLEIPNGTIGTLVYDDTICLGECWNVTAPVLSGEPTLNVGSYQSTNINDQLSVDICNFSDTGIYTFMCQVNGTSTPFLIQVTVLSSPVLPNLGTDRLICPGNPVTLSTPSQTGITYSWTGPAGFPGSTSSHISTAIPGIYILTATNADSCSVSDTITLSTLDDMPNTFVTYNNCHVSNGTQLNAGSGATTYAWSPAAGLSNTTISNPVANPVMTTTYTVIATFTNGCVATGNVIVTVPPVPVYSIGAPLTVCNGSCVSLSVPDAIPCVKSANWFYSSVDGAGIPTGTETLGTGNNICIKPMKSGSYCVTIIDCNGCEYTVCREITILKDCKKLPVSDDGCCGISTQRVSALFNDAGLFVVYPNPAKDDKVKLTFKVPSSGQIKISILNALGQMYSVLINENIEADIDYERNIDISKLSSGVYFLSLESAGITRTAKFVKQ